VSFARVAITTQLNEQEKAVREKKTGTKTLKPTNLKGKIVVHIPFRILSIDGGGIKGIFPAYILAEIEHRLKFGISDGKQAHPPNIPINLYFHLLAGTSTGGLLVLGLANSIPAEKLVELYTSKRDQIFKKK